MSDIFFDQLGIPKPDRLFKLESESAVGKIAEMMVKFEVKIPMRIFTWDGEKDTIMSPKDSVIHHKWYLRSGLLSIDPYTGFIKAWVGGINYKYFQYDHVKVGRRQVGSTFKPFLYSLFFK